MNEIYKNLTTIKLNKLNVKKVFKKSQFISQKLIFHCLKKKILVKKVDFFYFRSDERSELPGNIFLEK